MYDISSLRVKDLTFILLTWRKWLAPNNANRQQIRFNSGFKGLMHKTITNVVSLQQTTKRPCDATFLHGFEVEYINWEMFWGDHETSSCSLISPLDWSMKNWSSDCSGKAWESEENLCISLTYLRPRNFLILKAMEWTLTRNAKKVHGSHYRTCSQVLKSVHWEFYTIVLSF